MAEPITRGLSTMELSLIAAGLDGLDRPDAGALAAEIRDAAAVAVVQKAQAHPEVETQPLVRWRFDAPLVVEMSGHDPHYGRIHVEGCRDCKDPQLLGQTLDNLYARWPWPEELDPDISLPDTRMQEIVDRMMPCAKAVAL